MSILYRSFPTLDIAISSPFFGLLSEWEEWNWVSFWEICSFTCWGSPLVEPGHHLLLLGDVCSKQHVDSLDVGGHGDKLGVTLHNNHQHGYLLNVSWKSNLDILCLGHHPVLIGDPLWELADILLDPVILCVEDVHSVQGGADTWTFKIVLWDEEM